jgi:hypothetical protein
MGKQISSGMAGEERPQRYETHNQRDGEDHDQRTMPGEPTLG